MGSHIIFKKCNMFERSFFGVCVCCAPLLRGACCMHRWAMNGSIRRGKWRHSIRRFFIIIIISSNMLFTFISLSGMDSYPQQPVKAKLRLTLSDQGSRDSNTARLMKLNWAEQQRTGRKARAHPLSLPPTPISPPGVSALNLISSHQVCIIFCRITVK